MVLELSLSALYGELEEDPDLRRLGSYRVVADDRKSIIPIDVNLEGKNIHLGDGDFTDGFVAFCFTKAKELDLGTSKFTDLYLDEVEIGSVMFSRARASRMYFDYAKIGECHFGNFVTPELYFDLAKIQHIFGENLQSGIIYPEKLDSSDFDPETLGAHAHRLTFGSAKDEPRISSEVIAETGDADLVVRTLSQEDFLRHLAENPDLSRLGRYRVVVEDDELVIDMDLEGQKLIFGYGDFTDTKLFLGHTKAGLIDFSKSKFRDVVFQDAKIGDCFFDESEAESVEFGDAEVKNVFWEKGRSGSVYLDHLTCEQFNINSMATREFRLGEARVGQMFLSVGDRVERMYGERCKVDLLNLHEGKLKEVDFGEATVRRDQSKGF
jgi:uncharacterized protein YjbI with pentapeptide repeats